MKVVGRSRPVQRIFLPADRFQHTFLQVIFMKGTIALVLVWLKIIWLKEESLMVFKFLLHLRFLIKYNINTAVLRLNGQEMPDLCRYLRFKEQGFFIFT
jgi:hypothetical protein